ncbi:hypothetical protein D3C79_617080 [compost metagenome]
MTKVLEILLLVVPFVLNRLLQATQVAHNRLQRITAAAGGLLDAHLVQAVLQHAAHALLHKVAAILLNLVDRLVVEGQAVAAVFDNAIHLLLKLVVQRGQAVAHIAVATQFLHDHLVQRHPRFFQMLLRALVDPRQFFA